MTDPTGTRDDLEAARESDAPAPRMAYESDDDGYPEEAWLADFAARTYDAREAARFLAIELPDILERRIPCSTAEVTDGVDAHDRPCKRVVATTGGWSGAEELISLVLRHPAMHSMHDRWERGGLFSFEVPAGLLEPGPTVSGNATGPRPVAGGPEATAPATGSGGPTTGKPVVGSLVWESDATGELRADLSDGRLVATARADGDWDLAFEPRDGEPRALGSAVSPEVAAAGLAQVIACGTRYDDADYRARMAEAGIAGTLRDDAWDCAKEAGYMPRVTQMSASFRLRRWSRPLGEGRLTLVEDQRYVRDDGGKITARRYARSVEYESRPWGPTRVIMAFAPNDDGAWPAALATPGARQAALAGAAKAYDPADFPPPPEERDENDERP